MDHRKNLLNFILSINLIKVTSKESIHIILRLLFQINFNNKDVNMILR